ncbi:PTS system mannitol-specific IIA component [Paenibacillus phyllosphaerae]|uniref:Mannitol-specific phosphotransferase enzyme IIA component n=1 Tax=Paenibacillus phyllosphaerae TaxID=274593 RepID=A0A7W5FLD6_9BACL|nr:PTS sugar transporter subunit IIA [Paenibacillus phyllosphaerae]MBB3108988.1 PTS system mannitol-specific IIA component [Paenibacillus phyllosphaerae]
MSILSVNKVKLNVQVKDKYEAIRIAGNLLVEADHVPSEYVDKMIERENSLSTYMGGGLAIPHGTNEAKSLVRSTGLSVVVLPEGVDFGEGEPAHLVIGIAAVGDDHLDLLTSVAMLVSDEDNMADIIGAKSEQALIEIFEKGME